MPGPVARVVLLAASSALLAGCWPARFVDRPGVTGRVVSGKDRQPIPGATITVIPMRKEATLAVMADGKGQFVVKPLYDWEMNFILGERWPLRGKVEISAEGFGSQSRDLVWPLTGPMVEDLGEISLEPRTGGNP